LYFFLYITHHSFIRNQLGKYIDRIISLVLHLKIYVNKNGAL